MAEYKVLITTSGLGSRLGELTDYTNKALIRVADKPALSYIIESYPKDIEFVVTLGHFGDHVKQFLSLAYPDHKFTFIQIDKYKGEGSSLGYSIYQAKDELKCPFIFHASDTILTNYKHTAVDSNWIIGSYKEDTSQYRTIKLDGNTVVKINEKGELGCNYSYVGVAGIHSYSDFFKYLGELLEKGYEDISDVHAINAMLLSTPFTVNLINNTDWYDTGNTTELNYTRKSFKSSIHVLDKKDESIFFFDDCVIKFFNDKKINNNRVVRGIQLGNLTPEIEAFTENFYRYKKAEGSLFSKSVNSSKFKHFLNWTYTNLWVSLEDEELENKCYDFYIEKTKKRIAQYLTTSVDKAEYINGELIPSLQEMLNSIDKEWLCRGIGSQFHGDFILDNIIEQEDSYTLIDWRQDFAGNLQVGDLYYDLAKLNHNLTVNHDIVSRGLLEHSRDNCYILVNSKLSECKEVLHSFILEKGFDLKKVEVLTALIWINMAPLHEYPFSTFLYNFGKYNLNKALKL